MLLEDDDNIMRWETESPAYIDVPEDLIQRMLDLTNAVAQGHESMFLQAEATHIIVEVDKLMRDVVDSRNAEPGEEQ